MRAPAFMHPYLSLILAPTSTGSTGFYYLGHIPLITKSFLAVAGIDAYLRSLTAKQCRPESL